MASSSSHTYRRRVKRAIQMLQGYLLLTKGTTKVTGEQRRAVHYFLEVNAPDTGRRDNRGPAPEQTGLKGATP